MYKYTYSRFDTGEVRILQGVKQLEPHITTKLIYYQDWLQREIDKRLRPEQEVQQQQLAIQKR